jgi:hypothetical protein
VELLAVGLSRRDEEKHPGSKKSGCMRGKVAEMRQIDALYPPNVGYRKAMGISTLGMGKFVAFASISEYPSQYL